MQTCLAKTRLPYYAILGQTVFTCCAGYVTTSEGQIRQAFANCVELVKTCDYENYLWCIQLPRELRPAIFALRAFNIETAQVKQYELWAVLGAKQGKQRLGPRRVGEAVREAGLIPLRMQWWRDAVNSCYQGRPEPHPTVQALSEVIQAHGLTRYRLLRMVSVREDDLVDRALGAPGSLAEVESYAEGTAAQLLLLQLEAAGIQSPEAASTAAAVGKAVGMTALLRGTAHHAQRRRSYLPADLCAAQGVSLEDIFRGRTSDGMREVIREVAQAAQSHLREARELAGSLPPLGRRLLLPSVAAEMWLGALEKNGYDPFSQGMLGKGLPPLWYQLRLKYHYLRGTF